MRISILIKSNKAYYNEIILIFQRMFYSKETSDNYSAANRNQTQNGILKLRYG